MRNGSGEAVVEVQSDDSQSGFVAAAAAEAYMLEIGGEGDVAACAEEADFVVVSLWVNAIWVGFDFAFHWTCSV